jgi:hypothetical protein
VPAVSAHAWLPLPGLLELTTPIPECLQAFRPTRDSRNRSGV